MLLTASGAPGTAALARALRENGERSIRLVGTDMSELAVGRQLCDAFHVVPGGEEPGFADAVLELCGHERVDAVLPQSSYELPALAEAKDRFDPLTSAGWNALYSRVLEGIAERGGRCVSAAEVSSHSTWSK